MPATGPVRASSRSPVSMSVISARRGQNHLPRQVPARRKAIVAGRSDGRDAVSSPFRGRVAPRCAERVTAGAYRLPGGAGYSGHEETMRIFTSGLHAFVISGCVMSQAWSPGRAMFLLIGLAGLATKTVAAAAVIFPVGKVHTRVRIAGTSRALARVRHLAGARGSGCRGSVPSGPVRTRAARSRHICRIAPVNRRLG